MGGLALPILDCMLNESGTAFAATGAQIPVRFGTWYWGMGHTPGHAIGEKSKTGPGVEFLEETEALKPFADKINYFSGFNMPLDGRSNYTHFTGWAANRTGTAPAHSGEIPTTTLDLLVADVIGAKSRFRTIDASSSGMPRENYSARGTNSRAKTEVSPLAMYSRLFGPGFIDPNQADFIPDPAVMVRRSVLSDYSEQSQAYMKTIGVADRERLDQYFSSVRQVENQLALQLEAPPPNEVCAIPAMPTGEEKDRDVVSTTREMDTVVETHKVMATLMAMAVACGQTRVFNMVFTDNFANQRRAGESYTHHMLTHEEAIDEELGYQPATFWFQKQAMNGFAEFLHTMSSIKEGDGTLLDNSLIFATSETNYARVHTIDSVPMYLVGSAGGRVKTGMHIVGGGDPTTRVGLTAQQAMGVPVDTWGTGSLQTSKPISEILV
jgi:hypothetical protein